MDIVEALNWRYATKKFDSDKKIPEDKISLIKKAFNLSPSSYGLQPVKLVIIQNQELQEKLFSSTYNQKQISTASHVLVLCVETLIDEAYITEHFEREKNLRKTPDEILAPYRSFLINYFQDKEPDLVKEWALNQAYLALGNLLTICALEKIDACPIEGFEPQKYDEILKLKENSSFMILIWKNKL